MATNVGDRKMADLDKILRELGIGKYQIINFVIIYLCVSMDVIREATFIFTASNSLYRCSVPECETSPSSLNKTWLTRALPFENNKPKRCERYVVNSMINSDTDYEQNLNSSCHVLFGNTTEQCTSWVFEKGLSIVEELEIPCEDWKRSLVGSLNSGGQIVSFLFSGIISDKYGRRSVLIAMIVLGGCVGILQSFSQNYLMFAVLEFLTQSFGSGAYGVAFVMMVESLPIERRIYGIAILETVDTLSLSLLGLLAWASSSWSWFMRTCNIPSLFAIAFVFVLPESVRWLSAKGKGNDCKKILMRAAKLNGINYSQSSLMELNTMSTNTVNNSEDFSLETFKEETFISVIKSPRLLIRLILCAFCRFTSVLTKDGLVINSVNISNENNIFLNFILITLIELPSILVYYIILKFISRKIGLQISLIGAGVFCIIYGTTSITNELLKLIIYMIAKFFITISSMMVYIYTSECFPTTLRNSTFNFCAIIGRIGGVLAPQLLLLEKVYKSLPMILFGTIPFMCAILLFRLPNTRNKKLPDTIAEAEQL